MRAQANLIRDHPHSHCKSNLNSKRIEIAWCAVQDRLRLGNLRRLLIGQLANSDLRILYAHHRYLIHDILPIAQ